jgi:hypothetical protein
MRQSAILLAVAVLLAAAPPPKRVVLTEELVRIDAGKRRNVLQILPQQQASVLEAQFKIHEGGEGVRLLVRDVSRGTVAFESGYEPEGSIRLPLAKATQYRVEFENLRQRLGYAMLDFEAALIFGPIAAAAEQAQVLTPRRRYFTIAISLTLFAMIAAYCAVRLTPYLLDRRRPAPPLPGGFGDDGSYDELR